MSASIVLDDTVDLDLRTEWCADVPVDLTTEQEQAILAALDVAYWTQLQAAWNRERPGVDLRRVHEANVATWRATHDVRDLADVDDETRRAVHEAAVEAVDVAAVVDEAISAPACIGPRPITTKTGETCR